MLLCRVCGNNRCDLQFKGCGCILHVRCVPLSVIISSIDNTNENIPTANNANITCPVCRSGIVSGIYLFPISFMELDRSVELRKNLALAAARAASSCRKTTARNENGDKKRKRESLDEDFHKIQAESSYLLLSQSRSLSLTALFPDSDHHRTGRWTSEEVSFGDFIVTSFDRGQLPIPHGVKLNEFLGEMLLCKSSRLTKKMKNAKLSTRSYKLRSPTNDRAGLDCSLICRLEQEFLASLGSEPIRLELVFNITKMWRTHFSNLCLQVGFSKLDTKDWMASVEKMETRAAEAENFIRKARRRRMGLALKKGVVNDSSGVFSARMDNNIFPLSSTISLQNMVTTMKDDVRESSGSSKGIRIDHNTNPIAPNLTLNSNTTYKIQDFVAADAQNSKGICQLLPNKFDLSSQGLLNSRNRFMSDDFSVNMEELVDVLGSLPSSDDYAIINQKEAVDDFKPSASRGQFLDKIMTYIEDENLPFQHIDVWAPSFVHNKGMEQNNQTATKQVSSPTESSSLRLLNAGHATRRDTSASLYLQLNEFGQYSSKFSFVPGAGFPGRVFLSGKPSWEFRLDKHNRLYFERSAGAKVYGIKTAMGIPFSTGVGRVIVVFYSTKEMPEDLALLSRCVKDLSDSPPEPRWQLVIDTGARHNTLEEEGHKKSFAGASKHPVSGDYSFQSQSQPSQTTKFFADAANSNKCSTNLLQGSVQLHHFTNQQNRQLSRISISPRIVSSSTMSSTSLSLQTESDDTAVNATSDSVAPKIIVAMLPAQTSNNQRDEELQIATLLGDCMPASSTYNDLLNQCISLRLLLLRSPDRRSSGDNELLEVLRKSFQGYSKDNRRSGAELAALLAKDWRFLKFTSTIGDVSPHSPTSLPTHTIHTPHTMNFLISNDFSSTNAPMNKMTPDQTIEHFNRGIINGDFNSITQYNVGFKTFKVRESDCSNGIEQANVDCAPLGIVPTDRVPSQSKDYVNVVDAESS